MSAKFLLFALPLCFVACEDDACDRYVDYICECHPDEDCASLQNTYADPDPDLLDDCSISLEDQKDTDEETEHVCGEGGEDSAA